MTPRLSGHFSIFGLVFCVLKSIKGISRQWSGEKLQFWPLSLEVMLGLLYIECGLLRTRLLPFFSKFNTVWRGKDVPTLLTSIVGKNAYFLSWRRRCRTYLYFMQWGIFWENHRAAVRILQCHFFAGKQCNTQPGISFVSKSTSCLCDPP